MPALVPFGELLPSTSTEGMRISFEEVVVTIAGRKIAIAPEPLVQDRDGEGLMILSGLSLRSSAIELFHKETNAQVVCAELVQSDGVQSFRRRQELSGERESWLYILSEKGGAQIVPASFDSSSWLVIPAE